MSTWNSTEYSDALKGKCYSELTCIHCHDPHKPTGTQWSKSPEQDDVSCLKCHSNFNQPTARQQHTHHAPASSGDRCMNCHMPHINEGMQDVVRTHTIFSPTQADMIQQNQPNACNLCHLDKPIDWKLDQLKTWYGRTYDEQPIAKNYPKRGSAGGLRWLTQDHPATRLVAASAMARQGTKWAIPGILEMLDDEYVMNRHFSQLALEKLLDKKLNEEFGYWYYATKDERSDPIERIRKSITNHQFDLYKYRKLDQRIRYAFRLHAASEGHCRNARLRTLLAGKPEGTAAQGCGIPNENHGTECAQNAAPLSWLLRLQFQFDIRSACIWYSECKPRSQEAAVLLWKSM